MADDDRDARIAGWLSVEPLDELSRRRLVSAALRETEASAAPPARSSRLWRWVAAAAAVVVMVVGGLALLTADGGNDTTTAARDQSAALSPQAFEQALGSAPDAGDFGNLDDATNLTKLRTALDGSSSRKSAGAPSAAPASPGAASPGAASDAAGSTQFSTTGCARGAVGTVVARGTGTIDGRPVTVVLLEGADGRRSLTALFDDTCEFRNLSGSG